MYRVNFKYAGAYCHADFELEEDATNFKNQRGMTGSTIHKYELDKVYMVYRAKFPYVDFLKCFNSKDKAESYIKYDYVWSIDRDETVSYLEMEIE